MRFRHYLWLECLLVFGGLPIVILFYHQRMVMLGVLWFGAFLAWKVMSRKPQFSLRREWKWAGIKAGGINVIMRFGLAAPMLVAFTLWHDLDRLFGFPRDHPEIWALVMVLYPILSVFPQELIYRSFFYHRYREIFPDRFSYVLASAIAFSYVHIIFMNWVAIVFTFFGGILFAHTYTRQHSLALVWFEHLLFGCTLFTLGIGWYFYGAAWGR